MYLTKCSVSLDTTSKETTAYSDENVNGAIYAVRYVASTASCLPSTGTVTIRPAKTTEVTYISALSLSTDRWIKYPRELPRTSTDGIPGQDTDFVGVAPYIYNERIKVTILGGTSAQCYGDVEVFVEGGNG